MSNEWRFDDEGNRNNTDKTDDGMFENGDWGELSLRIRGIFIALTLNIYVSGLLALGTPVVAITSMLTGNWLWVNPILLFGALIINMILSFIGVGIFGKLTKIALANKE